MRDERNREMLIESTNARPTRTVANGTKLGRKSVFIPISKRKITTLRDNGMSIQNLASEVGVSRGTVNNVLKVA